jgi:hypothetical protein
MFSTGISFTLMLFPISQSSILISILSGKLAGRALTFNFLTFSVSLPPALTPIDLHVV